MAATGKTPILLYGSTTATNTPSAGNLTNSSDGCEIAINVADKNLFFKDSTNVVNTVPIRQSGTSSNGWLSSTDWNTFNNKQPAGTYVTSVTGTAPVVSSGGTTPAISMAAANGSTNGYLTSTDWTTFNNKAAAFTYTTNYIPYGQGTTTPNQSANLTYDGSLGVNWGSNPSATGSAVVIGNYSSTSATANSWYIATNKAILSAWADGATNANGATISVGWANGGQGPLNLAIGATTVQRLHASGGVSIGNTTDPGAGKLSVTSDALIGVTTTSAFATLASGSSNIYMTGTLFTRNTGSTSGRYYQASVDSGAHYYIYNDANTGVYLNYGGTSWNANSDERIKDIIEPITDAVQKVSTLRAVIGKYKKDEEGTRRAFLIAQDVQKILPEAVNALDDEIKTLGLAYSDVIPLLVAAIKEQTETINNLNERITKLENLNVAN